MHPLIFEIQSPAFLENIFGPSLKLHWYGVLIGTGFMIGLYLVSRQAKREGEDPQVIFDAAFWTFLWGLIGSRILFIITNLSEYLKDPIRIVKVWEGGIVFYGGFIGGGLFLWYFARKHKLNIWKVMDIFIPSLALAHVFGRMGCLCAGCCFGRPTDVWWALHYPKNSMAYLAQTKQGLLSFSSEVSLGVHPTPVYDGMGEAVIFLLLLLIRSRKHFHGQVLLSWLILYPILRSIGEMFRGDAVRKFLIPNMVSTSQFISIVIFILASYLFIYKIKQARAQAAADN